MEDLIQKLSKDFSIEPKWIKAIITQESAWNPYAIRFEPNYIYLFKPEIFAKKAGFTLDTETISQKISWGLGQIMGALAREQGFKGAMPELLKPEINILHICIRLKNLKVKFSKAEDVFAAYNGGFGAVKKINDEYKNQKYVDSILYNLQKLEN